VSNTDRSTKNDFGLDQVFRSRWRPRFALLDYTWSFGVTAHTFSGKLLLQRGPPWGSVIQQHIPRNSMKNLYGVQVVPFEFERFNDGWCYLYPPVVTVISGWEYELTERITNGRIRERAWVSVYPRHTTMPAMSIDGKLSHAEMADYTYRTDVIAPRKAAVRGVLSLLVVFLAFLASASVLGGCLRLRPVLTAAILAAAAGRPAVGRLAVRAIRAFLEFCLPPSLVEGGVFRVFNELDSAMKSCSPPRPLGPREKKDFESALECKREFIRYCKRQRRWWEEWYRREPERKRAREEKKKRDAKKKKKKEKEAAAAAAAAEEKENLRAEAEKVLRRRGGGQIRKKKEKNPCVDEKATAAAAAEEKKSLRAAAEKKAAVRGDCPQQIRKKKEAAPKKKAPSAENEAGASAAAAAAAAEEGRDDDGSTTDGRVDYGSTTDGRIDGGTISAADGAGDDDGKHLSA